MDLKRMGTWAGWAAALGLALLSAAPAQAQIARNSDAPVDVTADELEVINAQCLAIWRGAAEALQADARLRANVLKIYNMVGPTKAGGSGPSCGAVDRLEAEGDVYYVTPQQRIRGDAATYEADSEILVVTGDVVAAQGQNVLRGRRMIVNVQTGEAQMQTTARGRNTPGRVRGVFYPKKQQQQPAAKTAAPR